MRSVLSQIRPRWTAWKRSCVLPTCELRMEAYLRGEISSRGMSEWASMIQLVGAYAWLEDGRETPEGEQAWTVVQELCESHQSVVL